MPNGLSRVSPLGNIGDTDSDQVFYVLFSGDYHVDGPGAESQLDQASHALEQWHMLLTCGMSCRMVAA